MSSHALVIFILYFAVSALCVPFELSEDEVLDRHEESGGFYEGDMDIEQEERNGLLAESKRWPNNVVYYRINETFDAAHVGHILRGMQMIEEVSCIQFKPAPDDIETYIHVIGEPTGCHSKVGYLGKLQTVNLQIDPLDKGCFRLGTIIHELLHSLGFHHQQSTWNRDEFVIIAEENIKEGKEGNFKKRDATVVSDFDTEYDYGSVLHYSAKAFSKNGEDTIIPLKVTDTVIGQRLGMSRTDIDKLNVMYKCPIKI
ncbi:seminal metalloprotease 1 [Ceratitis capitata]|uniref:Metalloendopeptidase n=1 Tax=Ceratitis capitata TaxID=7213 RepID=A0A811UMM8_CERCA|nr:seminal metalloprotease 1 [Ceratitis capitata]CAD6999045.1 unnamed protein product [Ceratitis capitata]